MSEIPREYKLGIPWTKGNKAGRMYYVDMPKQIPGRHDLQILNPQVGVFVPHADVYQPVKVDHYLMEGRRFSDRGWTKCSVACDRGFTFYPNIQNGQKVPREHVTLALKASDDHNQRVVFIEEPKARHYTTQEWLPRFQEVDYPSNAHFLTPTASFGGRKKFPVLELPNRELLPQLEKDTQGQEGYWFDVQFPEYSEFTAPGEIELYGQVYHYEQQEATCQPDPVRVWIPWSPVYEPVEIRPKDTFKRVSVTSKQHDPLVSRHKHANIRTRNRDFRFWPPRMPRQDVRAIYQEKASARPQKFRVELAHLPLPTESVEKVYPIPMTRDQESGHLHLIKFSPYKLKINGGEVKVNGTRRLYKTQDVIVRIPPKEHFVVSGEHYKSFEVTPPPVGSGTVVLEKLPGHPDTWVQEFTLPSQLTFNYYPETQTGQYIRRDLEQVASSKNAVRTYALHPEMKLEMAPFKPPRVKSQEQLKRSRSAKRAPPNSDFGRIVVRRNFHERMKKDSVEVKEALVEYRGREAEAVKQEATRRELGLAVTPRPNVLVEMEANQRVAREPRSRASERIESEVASAEATAAVQALALNYEAPSSYGGREPHRLADFYEYEESVGLIPMGPSRGTTVARPRSETVTSSALCVKCGLDRGCTPACKCSKCVIL